MPNTTFGTPYVAGTDLVSSYPTTSSSLATRIDDVSIKGNGLNDQTGTTYTLVVADSGKTVTLSNASAVAVTIPTNAARAIATGAVIRLQNKGSGTVTVSPAGGVTLNGGNIIIPQFSAVQLVKLATDTWGQADSGALATGLVPIRPTSIANSGGSASLSGFTTTFTTVNSVSLNGCFTGDYDNYRFVANMTASGNVDVYCRMRAGGTDNSASASYVNQYLFAGSTSVSANTFTNTFWELFFALASTRRNAIIGDFFSPAQAVETAYLLTDRYSQLLITGGQHTVTSAFDGFTLYPATGTISGTISVYGYKK